MDVAALLTLISATAAALVAIIHAWRSPQARALGRETNEQVHELGKTLNGRLGDLLEATRQAAWHAGLLEGQRLARESAKVPIGPPGGSNPSGEGAVRAGSAAGATVEPPKPATPEPGPRTSE